MTAWLQQQDEIRRLTLERDHALHQAKLQRDRAQSAERRLGMLRAANAHLYQTTIELRAEIAAMKED